MALFKQMTAPSGVPREGGLDALKLLLAISVVGIHGNFLRDVRTVLSAVLVDGMFRIAVPTFFLIGGVFLARMTDHQIARWLRRLLGLYVIWMLAYSGYWLVSGRAPSDAWSAPCWSVITTCGSFRP